MNEETLKAILENAIAARGELHAAMPFADISIVIGIPATGQIVYCSSCDMDTFLKLLVSTVKQCHDKSKQPEPTHENPGSIN